MNIAEIEARIRANAQLASDLVSSARPSNPVSAKNNYTTGRGRNEDVDLTHVDQYYFGNDPSNVIHSNTGVRDYISTNEIKDRDWMRSSFNYLSNLRDQFHQHQKIHDRKGFRKAPAAVLGDSYAKGYRSFVDTSIGGNFPINTAPGMCHSCDTPMDRYAPEIGSGMGYWYWNAIESNAHDIHMRFGVMKFNTGLEFFGNWFDYTSHTLAQHGRAPGILYSAGQVAGIALGFVMPQVLIAGAAAKFFTVLGGSRFAYLSHTMPLYWTAVNNLFNRIATNLGYNAMVSYGDAVEALSGKSSAFGANSSYIDSLASYMPGIFSKSAFGSSEEGAVIDVRRLSGRAQRLQNQMNLAFQNALIDGKNEYRSMTSEALEDLYFKSLDRLTSNGKDMGQPVSYSGDVQNKSSTRAYLQAYLNTPLGKGTTDQSMKGKQIGEQSETGGYAPDNTEAMSELYKFTGSLGDEARNINTSTAKLRADAKSGLEPSLGELFASELNDGALWVTVRVDGTGSIGESFSNQTEQSQLSSTINSWAQARRQLSFNFMGGALLGDIANSVLDGVESLVAGGLDGIGLTGLSGLLLGAKIDIPKMYSSSNVSFPTKTYKVPLRAMSAHPLSILQDLMLPLSHFLAMAMPLSHGRSSYGAPFYCEVYDRGRAVTKLGIISSMSIERGTSGVGWTREGLPLGIDITFTVECLDEIMHMPINTFSGVLDSVNPVNAMDAIILGNEGGLADYVNVLSAMSLPDMVYQSHTWSRNLAQYWRKFSDYWDRDAWIQRIGSMAPMDLIRIFLPGTARR